VICQAIPRIKYCFRPLVALCCRQVWGDQQMRNLGIVALCAALAGCASSAADITPAYVSPVQYSSYNCQQLGLEAQSISARAAALSGAQDSQRTKDGVATAQRSSSSGRRLFLSAATSKLPRSSPR
jgi:hypothetical protein